MDDELPDGPALLPDGARHKKTLLLLAYAECGNLTQAAKEADVSRRTHYKWLETDPQYVLQFADAQEAAIDVLEAEARRRAIGGAAPEKGKVRGSDLLMIFLLKGLRPWKYRDNAKPDAETAEAGVAMGWEQQQALADLADEVLAERERTGS